MFSGVTGGVSFLLRRAFCLTGEAREVDPTDRDLLEAVLLDIT